MTGVRRIEEYLHDGLRFRVRDEGPADGVPVVLLHGFPQTSSCWHAVAPLLHEAGCRTYAPDQRGYSPDARPSRRRDYRTGKLVADVLALVEEIGSPIHLVGHDWGSAVGWMTAARHPDRITTFTAVSVPHPGALMASLVRSDQVRRSWYMGAFQLPFLPERVLASPRAAGMLRAGGMSREAVERYQREVVDSGALTGALHWYRALGMADPLASRAKVTVPTTLVWSTRDVALGRTGADLTAKYMAADYELVVLDGVSHWIPEEAPDALAAAALRRFAGR